MDNRLFSVLSSFVGSAQVVGPTEISEKSFGLVLVGLHPISGQLSQHHWDLHLVDPPVQLPAWHLETGNSQSADTRPCGQAKAL